MTACPGDNELAQLVDGTLATTTRERIERHLDGCDDCTQLVGELAWVVAPARAAPPGYRLIRALDDISWEAFDRDDRRVALAFGVAVDPRLVDLRHPNVARVYAVGTFAGEPFCASELLTITARGHHSLAVWRAALAGLAALHRAGITQAITPDHVFVDGDRVRLAAFTRPVPRTSGYLALELLTGGTATPRSDQATACIAILEALAGAPPFRGATVGALAVAMSTTPDPPAHLERHLFDTLARGFAPDPAKRWPDIDALAAALDRPRRRIGYLVAAAAAIAIVILVLALS